MADFEEQFDGEERAEFEEFDAPPEMEQAEKPEEQDVQESADPTYDGSEMAEGAQFSEAAMADDQQYEAAQYDESAMTEDQHYNETTVAAEQTEGSGNEIGESDTTGGIASRNDDDERKIFVGGVSWETTAKDLRDYFEKFGKVIDCTLKTDPTTGRSRGFGFVLFDTTACVDKVVEEKNHILKGKKIDPKKAQMRGAKGDPCKKVFVGGVSPDMPEEEIREYFGTFGKIEEIELPFDRVKNQRRAYVFISYESEEVVDNVVANPKQKLGGKDVDVRKATPRSDQEGYGGRGRGGQRGRGRGRGGYGGQMAGGYYQDGSAGAAAQPYDYSGYYAYGQGYGAGYAYPGYSYPGYDYSSYYGGQDWSSYQQQGYAQSYPDAQSAPGKAKRGAAGPSYHPYNR